MNDSIASPAPNDAVAALSLFFLPGENVDLEGVGAVFAEFGFDTVSSFQLQHLDARVGRELLNTSSKNLADGAWTVFVVVDYMPRPVGWKSGRFVEEVDNGRLHEVPEIMRFLAKRFRPKRDDVFREEPMLFTRSSADARTMLSDIQPEIIPSIEEILRRDAGSMNPPFPVIRDLGYHCRYARVCLVQFRNRQAICKVYRPGREQYLENALLVTERFRDVPEIAPVIAHGPNWLVMPYYTDAIPLDRSPRKWGLLPLPMVRRLAAAVRTIHEAGIAHLDFHPDHVLADPDGSLHIIDFDRVHLYEDLPPIEENVMLAGYDELMAYDGPTVHWSYNRAWERLVGMPLKVFLNGPVWKQYYWRFLARAKKVTGRLRNKVRSIRNRTSR